MNDALFVSRGAASPFAAQAAKKLENTPVGHAGQERGQDNNAIVT